MNQNFQPSRKYPRISSNVSLPVCPEEPNYPKYHQYQKQQHQNWRNQQNAPAQPPQQHEEQVYPKGNSQYVNFGKYKLFNLTWYDIANKGDFQYLKWCASTDKIQIEASAKPHLFTAMQSQMDPSAKWEEKREEKENKTMIHYVATINKELVVGPEIVRIKCIQCYHIKFTEQFKMSPNICNDCYTHHSVVSAKSYLDS